MNQTQISSKASALFLTTGIAVLLVCLWLHPRDNLVTLMPIVEQGYGMWISHMLGFVLGFWLLSLGFLAQIQSNAQWSVSWVGKLAKLFIVTGTILWMLLNTVEGIGLGVLVYQWQQASSEDAQTWFLIAQAVFLLSEYTLNSMAVIIYGVGIFLFAQGSKYLPQIPKLVFWLLAITALWSVYLGLSLALTFAISLPTSGLQTLVEAGFPLLVLALAYYLFRSKADLP